MKPRALAYPDLVLFNGKIRSFAADNSLQEAVACAGGRIVATGKSDDIRRLAGPDTQFVDLQGRRGEQPPIRRHEVARLDVDDVARDELLHGQGR